MTNYFDALELDLPAKTAAGKARKQVLEATAWAPAPTSTVAYVAASRVLLVGNPEAATFAHARIQPPIQLYTAEVSPGATSTQDGAAIRVGQLQIEGYLGRFSAWIDDPQDEHQNVGKLLGISNGLFDQVIDCGEKPLIEAAIPPPGYHYVGDDRAALEDAMASAPDLVGEFEKPKYFDYDPSICAHGRSGIAGCTRCLDACPTEAIISIGEQIEVNSYLCQGGGTCASRCPSGAITYRYPQAEDQIELVRRLIRDWRSAVGDEEHAGVSLLLFDNETGAEMVSAAVHALPEHVLPIRVEEIGAVGLDLMVSSIAYGATAINLLVLDSTPDQVRNSLDRDIALVSTIMDQLGISGYQVCRIPTIDSTDWSGPADVRGKAATFAAMGNKRTVIRSAIKHLAEQGDANSEALVLPEGSLFGQVKLNDSACTLCMGCVSVCPVGALEAGGDEPALKFIEANCVQCGICTRACPESALAIESRLHLDDELVRRSRILKREEPFRCIKCSKPFATHAMINRMTEKLSGHWMFETDDAINRLKMCEDCRVADMYDRKDMIG